VTGCDVLDHRWHRVRWRRMEWWRWVRRYNWLCYVCTGGEDRL